MAMCEKCKSSMVIIKSNTGAKHCMNCGWCSDDNSYKKVHTNADRIRSMTDEELARLFDSGLGDISMNFHCEECNNRLNCEVCYLDWLQSEAEQKGE